MRRSTWCANLSEKPTRNGESSEATLPPPAPPELRAAAWAWLESAVVGTWSEGPTAGGPAFGGPAAAAPRAGSSAPVPLPWEMAPNRFCSMPIMPPPAAGCMIAGGGILVLKKSATSWPLNHSHAASPLALRSLSSVNSVISTTITPFSRRFSKEAAMSAAMLTTWICPCTPSWVWRWS